MVTSRTTFATQVAQRSPSSARRSTIATQPVTPRRSRTRRSRTQPKRSSLGTPVVVNSGTHSEPNGVRPEAFSQRSRQRANLQMSPKVRKQALWTGGAIACLAALVVVPTRVASQAILQSSCEQVVQPDANISRGQLTRLIEIPTGSSKSAVQQVVAQPHCTLPSQFTAAKETSQTAKTDSETTPIERHAYPLAFDSEAWVILAYEADTYTGYDFAFKP